MKSLVAVTALSLVAASAFADNQSSRGYYTGGGIADVKLGFDTGGSLDWTAVEAIGGYKHSPYIGGEARLGFGSDDEADLMYASFYYRTESSNETAKTYLLFGYTFGQVKGKDTANFNGFSYGAGVGFPVSTRLNVNFEYRMIMDGKVKIDGDKENADLSGLSVNVDYRF